MGRELVDVSHILRISAANGLQVPYVGYVELDISVLGKMFRGMGFLVVKDPESATMAEKKKRVPGVLGCNVLRHMCNVLQAAGSAADDLLAALKPMDRLETSSEKVQSSTVRVAGQAKVLIPARTIRIVEGTGRPPSRTHRSCVLVERLADERNSLPLA